MSLTEKHHLSKIKVVLICHMVRDDMDGFTETQQAYFHSGIVVNLEGTDDLSRV